MTTEDLGNNFYSYFETLTKNGLHTILMQHGWTTEYEGKDRIEIVNQWSELTIEEWDNVVQMNGLLKNGITSYNTLTKIFEDLGTRFQSELYADNKNLLASHDIYKGRIANE